MSGMLSSTKDLLERVRAFILSKSEKKKKSSGEMKSIIGRGYGVQSNEYAHIEALPDELVTNE